MSIKVGIPRALMYYRFFPLWMGFFRGLGVEVVSSPETSKGLLERGLKRALDDVCLPIKAGFGHALNLCGQCDWIFLPRLICVEKDAYLCPKFTGFTDMIRVSLPELPKLLDPVVNEKSASHTMLKALAQAGSALGCRRGQIAAALKQASALQQDYDQGLLRSSDPIGFIRSWEAYLKGQGPQPAEPVLGEGNLTIAVLGHSYTLYDSFLSMGLLRKLTQAGVRTVRPDSIDRPSMEVFLSQLNQRPFWTSGKDAVGTSLYYLNKGGVDGFIYAVSFECGPDSMCREVVDYQAGLNKVPMMSIVLDEHTAEAGLITRLEAFMDMLKR